MLFFKAEACRRGASWRVQAKAHKTTISQSSFQKSKSSTASITWPKSLHWRVFLFSLLSTAVGILCNGHHNGLQGLCQNEDGFLALKGQVKSASTMAFIPARGHLERWAPTHLLGPGAMPLPPSWPLSLCAIHLEHAAQGRALLDFLIVHSCS